MALRKNEIVEESNYTLILCCFFICEIKKKLTTNNKKILNSYICLSGCPNYRITAIVFFLFSGRLGRGGGFKVDSS